MMPSKTDNPWGTCQVCGGKFLLIRGHVDQHGYQRVGDGWMLAACHGAYQQPYEQSCDALPRYLTHLASQLETRQEHRLRIETGQGSLFYGYPCPAARRFKPGAPRYADIQHERLAAMTAEVKAILLEIDRANQRLMAWQPGGKATA